MSSIKPKNFIATDDFAIKKAKTSVDLFYKDDDDFKERSQKLRDEIGELQEKLYASRSHALLIIFQGMDTAGKDGIISHVMSDVNPQGCYVHSFKEPSSEELAHDFLWRSVKELPRRGMIGIFNRSYYEETLVTRVHQELLVPQNLPHEPKPGSDKFWQQRFRSINHLEQHLDVSGTSVVKFFLHLSKKEQKQRLIARLENPNKHWKVSESDFSEREVFDDYQKAYESCIRATSSEAAPWYVIPADDKPNARLICAEIVRKRLESLDLAYPVPSKKLKSFIEKKQKSMVEKS